MTGPNIEPEGRKHSDVSLKYRSDRIIVHWEPQLCIHAAHCLRVLPDVFNVNVRPWIMVEAASPDEIADAVLGCPSGALRFERLDGGPQEIGSGTTVVEPQMDAPKLDGPLHLRGRLEIHQPDGSIRHLTRAALCRCGRSGNKPFCDNSHLRSGLKSNT